MSTVGQIEKATQARVVALLQQRLGYTYLGNWIDQDNANIDTARLTAWLKGRDVADILISRALHELTKAAGDASKNLYDRNKAVYEMLRYGIKVQPGQEIDLAALESYIALTASSIAAANCWPRT